MNPSQVIQSDLVAKVMYAGGSSDPVAFVRLFTRPA